MKKITACLSLMLYIATFASIISFHSFLPSSWKPDALMSNFAWLVIVLLIAILPLAAFLLFKSALHVGDYLGVILYVRWRYHAAAIAIGLGLGTWISGWIGWTPLLAIIAVPYTVYIIKTTQNGLLFFKRLYLDEVEDDDRFQYPRIHKP